VTLNLEYDYKLPGISGIASMNFSRNAMCTLLMVLMTVALLQTTNVLASAETADEESASSAEQSGKLYSPSNDAMNDVSALLETARKNDKLALVIMGANWCHDSRGLAARLYQEPLKSLVKQNYETLFVDVGFLNKGKDVITSLGAAVYYATPTVLIIDPVSGGLVNAENRHQWASADSISMDDSVAYFQLMADTDLELVRNEPKVAASLLLLLAEIDNFEERQAERLYAAYEVIGPMLEAYKEGNEPENFDAYWKEIRKFRSKVPGDVDDLRAQAFERVAAGDRNIQLSYPVYPAFSWDS
jgi:hypothetical protein